MPGGSISVDGSFGAGGGTASMLCGSGRMDESCGTGVDIAPISCETERMPKVSRKKAKINFKYAPECEQAFV